MQLSQNGFWLAEKQKKTRANWIRAFSITTYWQVLGLKHAASKTSRFDCLLI